MSEWQHSPMRAQEESGALHITRRQLPPGVGFMVSQVLESHACRTQLSYINEALAHDLDF